MLCAPSNLGLIKSFYIVLVQSAVWVSTWLADVDVKYVEKSYATVIVSRFGEAWLQRDQTWNHVAKTW